VNFKRYVPDKAVNIVFKIPNDVVLLSGEKLKILSQQFFAGGKMSRQAFDHKVLVADSVANWGAYSKFSVTKLINPEGVDKAVLTTSLLRLASSALNLADGTTEIKFKPA
jgi:hypothetical protein